MNQNNQAQQWGKNVAREEFWMHDPEDGDFPPQKFPVAAQELLKMYQKDEQEPQGFRQAKEAAENHWKSLWDSEVKERFEQEQKFPYPLDPDFLEEQDEFWLCDDGEY